MLAPPDISTICDVHTVIIKHGHALDIARALLAVLNVLMNVFLRRRRIAIETPNSFQFSVGGSGFYRIESVADAVTAAEED